MGTITHRTSCVLSLADEPNGQYPERFIIQALLLLKSSMGDWASTSPVEVPLAFVKQFAETIVTRLLPLRPIDLKKWSEDPEEWMNEEEADRWEFELRVSSLSATSGVILLSSRGLSHHSALRRACPSITTESLQGGTGA